jgi:lipopolysaccharide transport system ATP-binding protein
LNHAKLPAAFPDLLLKLSGVGKDYPVVSSSASRLRTVWGLLTGKAVTHGHCALDGVDLEIRRGESWGIIGENGAGKSTLMKIVAGVVKQSRGTKVLRGRVTALLELGTGFHPDYTGRENIFLSASLMGWSRTEVRDKFDAILEFAGIDEHIDQPVKTYSSGMVVRLGFAIATALTPDLLVTDEVLAVGDESFQRRCMRWLEDYRRQQGTLLLCSHSMYHIQSLCQNAIWIHHGKPRMIGNSFDVSQAYLAYHEAKNQPDGQPSQASDFRAVYPCFERATVLNGKGEVCERFQMGETITLECRIHVPDDLAPLLAVGVSRVDGTPIYGAYAEDEKFSPTRIAPKKYAFTFRLPQSILLPGAYRFRAHTMDEHGLRLFDTTQHEFSVTGETRETGFVRLEHIWESAREPEIAAGKKIA